MSQINEQKKKIIKFVGYILVYYKPYYELLKIYCRSNEIYPDPFYIEVEGIDIKEIANTAKAII